MTAFKLICIVDDSEDYQSLLQLYFKRYCADHPTRFFSSGQDFLDALDQLTLLPSLILLDRHMPGLDGHQVLIFLKQHPIYKRIPVVMMSAGAGEYEIEGCYEVGANSFLAKRFDPVFIEESLPTICRYWLELNQLPGNVK